MALTPMAAGVLLLLHAAEPWSCGVRRRSSCRFTWTEDWTKT
jgi:hypothetical protein